MDKPTRAWLRPSLTGGPHLGHLFTGEGTPSETPVVVLPLNEDTVRRLESAGLLPEKN